jgi:hypothetical protein
MAMRQGYRGEDMFDEKCRQRNLAAITYEPLRKTDLSRFSPEHKPPGWDRLSASQKGSISKFAWQIRAGDKLYVKDSGKPNLLVAFGHVLGKDGELAYYYDKHSPIRTKDGDVWRHLIEVDWEDGFSYVSHKDRSAQTTVLALDEDELSDSRHIAKRREYKNRGLSNAEVDLAEGLETAYPRATSATIRLILPKHVTLSKKFHAWLWNQRSIQGRRERCQIDMQFDLGRSKAMAEFKIAYDGNTKAAIREALGQLLEYNHYPGRVMAKAWFLVLDREPDADDCTFVKSVRERWGCPIYLGWERTAGFNFYPVSPWDSGLEFKPSLKKMFNF